ncbi:PA14 domain-containing protein [Pullulanibacillus sp. KACC 23026]|uniref:PA14 domain-containing protein n=1 Tax=Pullulanibacillus sp. KACC 23026 TaxID=3028315 RepID=UPI0023B1CAEE|nr:PA14 domain-containing protein [Pullulanibacillus sp. KACC 23026]WEG13294.1 PA14 domain-containing protein [Pullulanibacillus sp. KACC 23026]
MRIINWRKTRHFSYAFALMFLMSAFLFINKASAASSGQTSNIPLSDSIWNGVYYSNSDFTGNAVPMTTHTLSLDWGKGAPAKGIPADYFSAIFQRQVSVTGGTYKLELSADNKADVYVDGNEVLKASLTTASKSISLSKGKHTILVKYVEHTLGAHLTLTMTHVGTDTSTSSSSDNQDPTIPLSDSIWNGAYYSNSDFTGNAVLMTTHTLSLDWGKDAPAKGIPADYFSAVFQRQVSVTGGTYKLDLTADNKADVYMDGNKVLNASLTTASKSISLSKGEHTILVKYVEHTLGASLTLTMTHVTTDSGSSTSSSPPKTPGVTLPLTDTEWNGVYYPNQDLTGTPVKASTSSLDYDWGSGAPASGIPSDNFSAVFQRNISFSGDPTDLEVWADDGAQVYLDDKLVIDQLNSSTGGFWHKIVTPSSGEHKVEIVYADKTGDASLRFETGSPYRTLDLKEPSNITASAIESFLTKYNSPLADDASAFIDAQKTYGINATYLVAHAILETGWGKSQIAEYKNNLYGYKAYDVCPFTCSMYFPSQADSINYVSYNVAKDYLSPSGSYYIPEYGPNLIGMNTYYATGSTWYSSIASLMEEIQPYKDVESYYNSAKEMSVTLKSPGSYGSDMPASVTNPDEVNFPGGITATVTTDGLSFRSIPYVSTSTLITSLGLNTKVTVLGYNTDVKYNSTGNYEYHWYRVSVNGKIGWVYGMYLNIQNLLQVDATSLNIRTEPSAGDTPTITPALTNDQYVQVLLDSSGKPIEENNFYEVQVPGSTTIGWVSADYVDLITQ